VHAGQENHLKVLVKKQMLHMPNKFQQSLNDVPMKSLQMWLLLLEQSYYTAEASN